jgi:hypothetical protein
MGDCVTRRRIRAESWYFSRKVVTVQGEYGVSFAVMVQSLLATAVSRYKVDASHIIITGYKAGCGLELDRGIKH